VVIEGQVRKEPEETRLQIRRMEPIGLALPRLVNGLLFVVSPGRDAEDFVKELRRSLDQYVGSCRVQLGFELGAGHCLISDIAASLSYRLHPEEFKRLRRHPAVRGVVPDVGAIELPKREWQNQGAS